MVSLIEMIKENIDRANEALGSNEGIMIQHNKGYYTLWANKKDGELVYDIHSYTDSSRRQSIVAYQCPMEHLLDDKYELLDKHLVEKIGAILYAEDGKEIPVELIGYFKDDLYVFRDTNGREYKAYELYDPYSKATFCTLGREQYRIKLI